MATMNTEFPNSNVVKTKVNQDNLILETVKLVGLPLQELGGCVRSRLVFLVGFNSWNHNVSSEFTKTRTHSWRCTDPNSKIRIWVDRGTGFNLNPIFYFPQLSRRYLKRKTWTVFWETDSYMSLDCRNAKVLKFWLEVINRHRSLCHGAPSPAEPQQCSLLANKNFL